jgi:hypothetical protein
LEAAHELACRALRLLPAGAGRERNSNTYVGAGRLGAIAREDVDGGQRFIASVEDYQSFKAPVGWRHGPTRDAQISIQPITRLQFETMLAAGRQDEPASVFGLEAVRESAVKRELDLPTRSVRSSWPPWTVASTSS